jgi:nucleoside-diphosphate-sugar epimerase
MSPKRPLPAGDLDHVVRGGAALWPQLRNARIFMTGATGFFGRWLLESLLAADKQHGLGVRIFALSRDPASFLAAAPHLAVPSLSWMRGSVATLDLRALELERFGLVIHLATEADLEATRADPAAAIGVITEGTRRVLDVAARTGAQRFLFTSSGAVYGRQPPGMERIPEEYPGVPDPLDRQSPYAVPGEAKRQAELLCAEYAGRHGLRAVVARGFTFAGPALPTDSKFAFGNFMGDALAGRPIRIRGDGTAVRSYLYAADLAAWLWALLLKGTPGRAYNVGSEEALSMRQLADAVAAELGSPGVEVLQQAKAGAVPERYVPSTARARQELGLREGFGIREIIRRTADWYRGAVRD